MSCTSLNLYIEGSVVRSLHDHERKKESRLDLDDRDGSRSFWESRVAAPYFPSARRPVADPFPIRRRKDRRAYSRSRSILK